MQRCWLCTNSAACTITIMIMSSNLGPTLPALPITIIDTVLSCIPTRNRIVWEDGRGNNMIVANVDGPFIEPDISW